MNKTLTNAKTSELLGPALDYAVALAVEAWKSAHTLYPTMTLDPTFCGIDACLYPRGEFGSLLMTCVLVPNNPFRQAPQAFCPSIDWSQGGPLLDAHCKSFGCVQDGTDGNWRAFGYGNGSPFDPNRQMRLASGPSILIAACRAIVAAKLGDEVRLPSELFEGENP